MNKLGARAGKKGISGSLITLNESVQLLRAEITIQRLDHLPFPLPAVGACDQQFPLLTLATCGAPYTSQTLQPQRYFTASLARPAPGNHNPHRPEWRKWLWFPSTFHTSNGQGIDERALESRPSWINKLMPQCVCVCVCVHARAYFFLCHLNCACVRTQYNVCWGTGEFISTRCCSTSVLTLCER